MHSLHWLEQHMHHCADMAQRLHQQFSYEYATQPLADWQAEFAEGQRNGDWKCLVALEQGRLLGGACLATADLPERPDLGPWLACVLVEPEARGRGLAAQLIEAICAHSRSLGIPRLYLHTHDQSAYYAKRGWYVLERFEAWNKEQWLMARDL
nr:GNAT family N-acetyltransferase [uncultured Pseudomonas sp.]